MEKGTLVFVLISVGLSSAVVARGRVPLQGGKAKTTDELLNASYCSSTYSCQNCYTSRICRQSSYYGWSSYKVVACPAFCDFNSGTCTDVPDPSCGATDDDFVCVQKNGVFPGFKTNEYHVCTDYVAKKFTCAQSKQYNPTTKKCEENYSCGTFTCSDKLLGHKVKHPCDSNYFAYCGGTFNLVDQCPSYYRLNETSQQCEPACTEEGNFEDLSDCTKYIRCSYAWWGSSKAMTWSSFNCPSNTGYDLNQKMCVSLVNLPNCKKSLT